MDRQKALLIFGAAWVSAALLAWFVYAKTSAPRTEKTVRVVAATRDMPAGSRLKKTDLKLVTVSEKDLPRLALTSDTAAENRVLLYPVNASEPLTTNKLTSQNGAEGISAMIEPGRRAISVQISDASGVAGLIQPRSRVDVLFTRPGAMSEAITATVVEDVPVLSIGRVTEIQNIDPKAPRPQQQAVTLMVTPEEARKIELAKNQGKISLSLRNPLDRSTIADNQPVAGDVLDPHLQIRGRRNIRPVPAAMNPRDNQVWASLAQGLDTDKIGPTPPKPEKKEPPKPKFVVDVFRGDKHLQEAFYE